MALARAGEDSADAFRSAALAAAGDGVDAELLAGVSRSLLVNSGEENLGFMKYSDSTFTLNRA